MNRLNRIVRSDMTAGIGLLAATVVAMAVANSPWSEGYHAVLSVTVWHPLHWWINDGLMTLFFVVIGLEIKRELLCGHLSHPRVAVLPIAAALGGIALPAAAFLGIAWQQTELRQGWPIPTATDIAFVIGLMALLGDRVPLALKVTLTALATVDDVAAVTIIAVVFSEGLSWLALAIAAAITAGIWLVGRFGRMRSPWVYALAGLPLWFAMAQSGVHATLAGVLLGFAIPLRVNGHAVGIGMETALRPWVYACVLPLFALGNAGVDVRALGAGDLLAPLPAAIVIGLVAGKPLGILAAGWVVVQTGAASLPLRTSSGVLAGLALLGGVGFTMSLFMSALAFPQPPLDQQARLGVLIGSVVAGTAGWLWLRFGATAR